MDRHKRLKWSAKVVGCMAALCFAFGGPGLGLRPCEAVDKSGVGPNVITLPDGPGSIQGMGEDFEPSLSSGTAEYTFGLAVPPGFSNYEAGLSFSYDSGGGNGPLGFGWGLDVPFIQRKTARGVPRYVDADNGLDDDWDGEVDEPDEIDRFIDDSDRRLIPRSDGFYLASEEEDFIRYRRVGDHWEGTLPTGIKVEFGVTPGARIRDAATGRDFAWFLERVTDPLNVRTVTYSYTSFAGRENLNQIYLSEIRYGPGEPPWENMHFVKFSYEPRSDWFEEGLAGFPVRTGMRLKRVVVGTQGPVLEGHLEGDFNEDSVTDFLDRIYELAYDKDPHWSLLTSIRMLGADGVTTQLPMTMDYSQCVLADALPTQEARIQSINTPLQLVDNEAVEFVDLNGDALPDILQTDPFVGPHKVFLNLGEVVEGGQRAIKWGPATIMPGDERTWAVNLASEIGPVAFFDDMDGEGNADYVYKVGPDVFYFPNLIAAGGIGWGPRVPMALNRNDTDPSTPYLDDNTERADIDGDQHGDIIQSVTVGGLAAYRVWHNYGNGRYAHSVTVPHETGFMLADEGVAVEDFNGDGLPDITRIRPREIWVLPGLGYGNFGPMERVRITGGTLSELDLAKVELEDINSDGLVDLLVVGGAPGEVAYWLNLGNYTLDVRRRFTGFPVVTGANSETRFADMNGNGTIDYVLMDPYTNPRMQIVDMGEVLGCVPNPNLLIRIDNGSGRTIRIDYRGSALMAVEDAAAGEPWTDPMPFPMSVVSAFHVDDGLGNVYDTEYRYRDGYYSAEYKFFTGFGQTTIIAPGEPMAPTQIMRITFDVGKEVRAMIGSILRQTLEDEHGAVFWDEVTQWESRVLYTGIDGHESVFAYPVAAAKDILERGHGEPKHVEAAFKYDDYGNLIETARYGIVVDGDRGAFHDEHIEVTNFAHNVDQWLLRYPSQILEYDLAGELIKLLDIYYDDETFAGDNLGEIVLGRETLRHEWFDVTDEGPSPLTGHGFIFFSRNKYDEWGNAYFMMDPMGISPGGVPDDDTGHYTTVEFDEFFHFFPVKETLHVGGGKDDLVAHAEYDWGLGSPTVYTDFNGLVTTHHYDPRGLLTSVVRPGHTEEFPTTEYAYALAVPFGAGGMVNYVETRLLDREPGSAGPVKRDHYFISRTYVDGLGRTLMTKDEAEAAPGSDDLRVAITGAVRFNGQGLSSFDVAPFFSALPGADLDSLLAFEDLRDPEWRGWFHEDGGPVLLDFASAPQNVSYYDAAFRVERIGYPDGTESRVEFEPLIEFAFDEADSDPASPHFNTPAVGYLDGLQRLIRFDEVTHSNDDGTPSDEAVVWSTVYEYRADGVLERIIDSQQNERLMIWDNSGAILEVFDPDGGWLEIVLDDGGFPIELNDWRKPWLTMVYDGINRLTSEDFHDEGDPTSAGRVYDPELPISETNRPDIIYVYDDPAGPIDLGDGEMGTATWTKGFLSHVSDLSGEEHNSYDIRGNVEWTVKRIPDPVTGEMVSYKTSMTYDPRGKPVSLTYPDGDRVTYAYGKRMLLSAIGGGATVNRDGNPFIIDELTYLPSGQRERVSYGNGVVSTMAYDRRGRMTELRSFRASDPEDPLLAYRYTFGPASNIRRIDDLRPGSERGAGDERRNTQLFAYDDLYRLLEVQYSFGLPGTQDRDDGRIAYRYDRIGNMLAKTSTLDRAMRGLPITDLGAMSYGGANGAWGRTGIDDEPGPHALTGVGEGNPAREYSYDPGGSLLEGDGIRYSWNFLEQMAGAETDDMRAVYKYDYAGRRVVKSIWERQDDQDFGVTPTRSTLYIDAFFEIRDFNQPTKYVYDGDTRVAKVTGTLETSLKRIQRFRIVAGHNLISLAVDAKDAAEQLGIGQDPNISNVFLWDAQANDYVPVDEDTPLPKGSILWLDARESGTLELLGTYKASATRDLPVGPGLFSFASLDAVNLSMALPPGVKRLASFDAESQTWKTWFTGDEEFLSDVPPFMESGQPVFVDADATLKAQLPEVAQQIHYYLQDHLGSSNLIVDAEGNIVKETTYYPFGETRHELDEGREQGVLGTPYGYVQKEKDEETGLHYFEARYLASSLARFTSVDPLADEPEGFIGTPQAQNMYAYSENNPIVFSDPTGMKKESLFGPKFRALAQAKFSSRGSKVFGGDIEGLDDTKASRFQKSGKDKTTGQTQSEMVKAFISGDDAFREKFVADLMEAKLKEAVAASVDKKGKLTETGRALQTLSDLTDFIAGALEDEGTIISQKIDGQDLDPGEVIKVIRATDLIGKPTGTGQERFKRLEAFAKDFKSKLEDRIKELKAEIAKGKAGPGADAALAGLEAGLDNDFLKGILGDDDDDGDGDGDDSGDDE